MEKNYYKHYKGGKYLILNIGFDSETHQKMVVYKALYGDGDIWIRPYSMFFCDIMFNGEKMARFKKITEEEALFTQDEIKYLDNKHKGGINNVKGNDYELFYVVKEILCFVCEYNNLDDAYIIQQKSRCYVDDVVEYSNNHVIYCQLKNVKDLKWNDSLISDFKKQSELSNKLGEPFRLRLVYSSEDDEDIKVIPSDIKGFTETEFFYQYKIIDKLIYDNKRIISLFKERYPHLRHTDQVCNFASMLVAVLKSDIKYDSKIKLRDVISKVEKLGAGYTTLYPEHIDIPIDIKKRLDSIINLEYQIIGEQIYFKYYNLEMYVIISDKLFDTLRNADDIIETLTTLF